MGATADSRREPRKGAWPHGALRSRSGTGLSAIASATAEAAIPRCLQRFDTPLKALVGFGYHHGRRAGSATTLPA
jgi:hypothetical protein